MGLQTLAQSAGWLAGRSVGWSVGPGWNMQLCIFKFMFLHLPLLRLARSLCAFAPNCCKYKIAAIFYDSPRLESTTRTPFWGRGMGMGREKGGKGQGGLATLVAWV